MIEVHNLFAGHSRGCRRRYFRRSCGRRPSGSSGSSPGGRPLPGFLVRSGDGRVGAARFRVARRFVSMTAGRSISNPATTF